MLGASSSHEDKITEEYKNVCSEFLTENFVRVQPDGEMAASITAFIDLINGHQCSQVISTKAANLERRQYMILGQRLQ